MTTPQENNPTDAELSARLEEYRLIRMKVRRQAMRRVRNTLIVLAMLAGGWFLYLFYKSTSTKED